MTDELQSRRILITSGPTRANLDAVRFISNRSTGRLGCAMAEEALDGGAEVTLVAGPESQVPAERAGLDVVGIETVQDLVDALEERLPGGGYDAVIHAMAVLDYVPASPEQGKVRSGRDEWTLRLTKTPKVIRKIKGWVPEALLVGFKLEVGADDEALRAAATDSMQASGAELTVANDLEKIGADVHPALIIDRGGEILARPNTKAEIAAHLCGILARKLAR